MDRKSIVCCLFLSYLFDLKFYFQVNTIEFALFTTSTPSPHVLWGEVDYLTLNSPQLSNISIEYSLCTGELHWKSTWRDEGDRLGTEAGARAFASFIECCRAHCVGPYCMGHWHCDNTNKTITIIANATCAQEDKISISITIMRWIA